MTSLNNSELIGSQRPRISSIPPYVSTSGPEAIELTASAGLVLDDWEAWVLTESLGERPDGKWSAPEVGLSVGRQNGKGSILEARELFGLFLADEELIIHSAHLFKTSLEAFRRILRLIEQTPDLRRKVKRVSNTHGSEGIELKDGSRLNFVARSKGGGRGLSGDLVILDEAFNLTDEEMSALLPILSARPNPQTWFTSSPALNVVDGEFLLRLKARGEAGSKGLAWFDWGCAPGVDLDDRDQWAASNPGLGIRLNIEAIERERESMKPEDFARERLGIWPETAGGAVISPDLWASLAIEAERPDEIVASLDVSPDRQTSSIVMAGRAADGRVLLSIVDCRPGTDWIPERVKVLTERWSPLCWVIDELGPAYALVHNLGLPIANRAKPKRGDLVLMRTKDVTSAWGLFVDAANQKALAHLDESPLNTAVALAKVRPVGDGSAWARKGSTDITPLVAATSAHWALTSLRDDITKVCKPTVLWL